MDYRMPVSEVKEIDQEYAILIAAICFVFLLFLVWGSLLTIRSVQTNRKVCHINERLMELE